MDVRPIPKVIEYQVDASNESGGQQSARRDKEPDSENSDSQDSHSDSQENKKDNGVDSEKLEINRQILDSQRTIALMTGKSSDNPPKQTAFGIKPKPRPHSKPAKPDRKFNKVL